MKSACILSLITLCFFYQARPDVRKLIRTHKVDSTTILGYVDVAAQIPVRIKVPLNRIYRDGQRIMCSPLGPIEMMNNTFVEDRNGRFPVIIVKSKK